MSFAKLDSGIIRSSIWFEPLSTRILWITMLAIKDENGFVATSRKGLIAAANIQESDFDIAIKCLESPDLDSRTLDNEGKRIEKIEGGWIILNNEKYKLHSDLQREKTRERVKKFRESKRIVTDVTKCNVTHALPSVSVSASISESEEGMQGEIQKIYDLYPTRDENNSNRSTGKCGKDKDKIKKLIIEKKPIEKLIREYVEDCKQTKIYLKGFSVFLNQLPETPEKQEAIQKPKQANLGLAYIQQEFFKND